MERLRQLRKERGLSQVELGKALNIAQNTLSAYECGSRDPDTATLSMIARYFGVTTDYLLGREEKAPSEPSYSNMDDVKVALFGGDGEVTDEMWDEVVKFADYVKAKYLKDKK